MSDNDSVEVSRDERSSRYVATEDGAELGSAFYEDHPDGRVTFTHTEVDESTQGRGIGGRLVRQALDDVRRRGLKVDPRCPFVAEYIDEHAEYQDLLVRQ
jgi:predicted GNAT family acetyltransferase